MQDRRHGGRSRGKAARASPTPRCRACRAKSRLAVDGVPSPDLDQRAGEEERDERKNISVPNGEHCAPRDSGEQSR